MPFSAILATVIRKGCLIAPALLGAPLHLRAQTPTRQLPESYVPGVAATVSIVINSPGGTGVVGVEEVPPSGWSVSAISHGGEWDIENQKVKWGPFFGASIPSSVSYSVTPPGGSIGEQCFSGTASFDGINHAISGENCIAGAIPAVSAWGAAILAALILLAGTYVMRRRPRLCGSVPLARRGAIRSKRA